MQISENIPINRKNSLIESPSSDSASNFIIRLSHNIMKIAKCNTDLESRKESSALGHVYFRKN